MTPSPALSRLAPEPIQAPAPGLVHAALGVGGALLAAALCRRRVGRVLVFAGGCALLARAWRATERRRRPAAPGAYAPLEVRASVEVDATPAAVYAAWRDPAMLRAFIGHLRAVEPLGAGRWRWSMRPTASVPAMQWTMVLEEDTADGGLIWHAQPTATLQARVGLRCEALADSGRTAVHLVLCYRPLSSAADLVVRALGPSLQQEMHADLARFRAWVDAPQPVRAPLGPPAPPESQPALGPPSTLGSPPLAPPSPLGSPPPVPPHGAGDRAGMAGAPSST